MSQSRLFIKNFFSLMMGKAIVRLTSFASTLYLARVLGPAEFGQFSLALAIGFVLSFVTNLGLDNLIVREIARTPEKANRLLGDALILKTPVLPFGFLIALPFASAESRPLFLLLAGYGILHAYLLLFCAAFRGIERMEFQALILSVQIFLIAVGTIAAIWLTGEAIWAAVVHLVATAGVALWAYGILLRNGLRPSYRWQPLAWRQLLQTVLPFGLVIVGLAIYDRQGIALIKLLCGEAAAGWFNAAYSFIPILVNIPDIIINTLFP
ncbi:MAG TPA: hypothetical protein ENN19_01935, partial [Chloroflexi bacterium]|nr:hypothetical protein [Chloroflexota bacterium]